jgi:hypothetical protein
VLCDVCDVIRCEEVILVIDNDTNERGRRSIKKRAKEGREKGGEEKERGR